MGLEWPPMSTDTSLIDQTFSPVRWEDGLKLLDQTRLPAEETWLDCDTPEDVAAAIYRLSVRNGAT